MNYKLLVLIAGIACCTKAAAQSPLFNASDTPKVFAPQFISDGFDNRDMTIAPGNDLMLFTLQHRLTSAILFSKKIGSKWTKPEIVPFSGKHSDLEPAFSPDGKRLFFVSNRPIVEGDPKKDFDIWYVDRNGNDWSEPVHLDSTINTIKDEFYPSIAKNGNLYFTRDNNETKEDIFIAQKKDGGYQQPIALADGVNSKTFEFNAFIDPDERFIIFSSYKRADDLGGGDLYISVRKNSTWQPALHLNAPINSNSLDYCPFVSFDGKYLFFTSKRATTKFPPIKKQNLKQLQQLLFSNGNGSDDIYIIKAKILEAYIK
jgi:Tol biopolymer transport system component